MNLDRNIDNYNLEKLLDLFNLSYDFTPHDLKITKKKVLMLHPDKSGADNDTFIFFVKAYKKLEMIYQYIQHAKTEDDAKTYYDADDKLKKYLDLKKINSYENQELFLKEFNKMFDSVYVKNENENNGHAEWLKSEENMYDKNDIEKSRKQIVMRQETIEEADTSHWKSGNSYYDVKEAYTKSIFDIDANEEYNKKEKFNSVDEYKRHRSAKINPLAEEQSFQYIRNKEEMMKNNALNMAYDMMNVQEKTTKNMNDYASKFLYLNN